MSQTSSTAALSVPDSTTNSWETPDPGLVVTEQITESDIDTDDIADIDASTSESSSPDNPLINFEAKEAGSSEEEPARKKDGANANLIACNFGETACSNTHCKYLIGLECLVWFQFNLLLQILQTRERRKGKGIKAEES